MVVAKGQRKGKAWEKRTKEKLPTWVRTSCGTNTPPFGLALNCMGQAQAGGDEAYRKREPGWIQASPLRSQALMPHGCSVLCLLNKTLSSKLCWMKLWAVTLIRHFKSLLRWDRTQEITHTPDTVSPRK